MTTIIHLDKENPSIKKECILCSGKRKPILTAWLTNIQQQQQNEKEKAIDIFLSKKYLPKKINQ